MGLDALLLHFVSGMHPGDQAETPFQYLTAVPNEDTSSYVALIHAIAISIALEFSILLTSLWNVECNLPYQDP
jgi:hypothetical protein